MDATSRGTEVAPLVSPRRCRRGSAREAELIARFRDLPGVCAGSCKKPPLPKPLIKIGKGAKTLAEIVSVQRW